MVELPGPVVDGAWLAGHLGRPGLVVVDTRWRLGHPGAGRRLYDEGHVPGAVHLDVDGDLAAPAGSGPGRHPLPDPVDFAATLAAAGIDDTTAVVAYDDAGGSIAARLWWMLDVTGRRAAVLDSGLAAWPGPLSTDVPARSPASPSVVDWPLDRTSDGLHLAAADVVVDARAPERYRGDVEPIDPRAGHVPGAVNAPWAGNLDDGGRFLPPGVLAERYAAIGIRAGTSVAVYCGSGVTACHDVLALRLAGVADVRLYPGSWSDWSSDPSRPVATGDSP